MKDAPFNITAVILGTIFVVMIAGGIWATIFNAMELSMFWGVFLSAFLAVPLGSLVRQTLAGATASQAGIEGKSPMAFSLPIRLLIGAIVAACIASVFSLSTFYTLGFLTGAVASLMTSLVLTLVFYLKVSLSS